MSQKLALIPLNLADNAESLAHGVILLLVLAIGFVAAWLIQSARRQHAVRQLIDLQLEDERARIEENRLLAEDMLQEQASRIAQQDRSIEHLKNRLARQIAQQQGSAARPAASAPRPASPLTRSGPGTPSGPAQTSVHTPAASPLIQQTVDMATRATAIRRSQLAAPLAGSVTAPLPATAGTEPMGTRLQSARPDYLQTPLRHDPGLGGVELHALRRQLRLEQAGSREKARLLRQYESDASQWQQACQRSEARRASLQLTVDTLEKLLQESRELRASAECELQRLREQRQQQQAIALMDGANLARKATSFRLDNAVPRPEGPGTLIPNTQILYPHLSHVRPGSSGSHDGSSPRPS